MKVFVFRYDGRIIEKGGKKGVRLQFFLLESV